MRTKHTIDIVDEKFIIKFSYAQVFVDKIRQLPGRYWDATRKANIALISSDSATWLAEFALANQCFVVSAAAQLLLDDPSNIREEEEKHEIGACLIDSDVIAIKMPWGCRNFDVAKAHIKSISGRYWDGTNKQWLVPLERGIRLLDLLSTLDNFTASNELATVIKANTKRAMDKLNGSIASVSEFSVVGLGGELYPFQKAGVEYAVDAKRTFIADEMGLGKTIQALATIQHLDAFPAIIVVPACVKLNWQREVIKWLPGRSVAVWSGRNGNGTADVADIIVINYAILADRLKQLKVLTPKAVILDESHYIKNRTSKRSKAAILLGKEVDVRLCLTGTPVLNRPSELVNQLKFLGRLKEFGGFWEFANHYCAARKNQWGWDFGGASNLDELNTKLRSSCFVRRKKMDVLTELPDKRRIVVPMEIDNWDDYNRAVADLITWLMEQAIKKDEFKASVVDMTQLEKQNAEIKEMGDVANKVRGAEQLVRFEALKQVAVVGKIKLMLNWITNFLESGEKLVVFAHHRNVVDAIAKEFKKALTIKGGDSPQDRQDVIDKFQNDKDCKLIVCSIGAAGIGITLTAASNVAFVELGWTPAAHDQAEDRLHRIGQEQAVTVWYLLAANTIEEEIVALLDSKRAVVNAATDGGEQDGYNMLDALATAIVANYGI